MINELCLKSKHARGIGLPINYVSRNAHFSINSGDLIDYSITPSLQELPRLQKNIYINNMAKRQAISETNSLDKKFEIDTDIFVVVTNFNGHILVHIRKYNGDFATKEGVYMFTNQYYQLLELLQKKEKGTLNMGQMRIKRTKGAIMVERLDKGSSIQLKNMAITNMQLR